YERGTNILERFRWNCIVADSDDSAVNAIITAFVRQSYETGHLGFACIAGKSSQTLDARMSYATICNDEKIIFVLNGWTATDGTIYDGWRAAIRIGGMIASVETNASLTHDVISNAMTLIEPLTNGKVIRAEQRGCLVLSLNDSDQIWIDNAINTLVSPDANADEGWKKIRRTKTRFEVMERINSTCDKLIGNINNDTLGRGTVVAAMQKQLRSRNKN
ncbi:MAG: phage tail sheath subtilisin-like domain-containing protein, partial [Selenomonadaceae bacterium]|nr:phage tail sheath subtilisin-like domain-containing protein [Selenomonadaceae bacterium]